MVAVFLAVGFEEIEALATVDILRRAGLEVITVGVDDEQDPGTLIYGAHSIGVIADTNTEVFFSEDMEAMILPGGMPGTLHLEESAAVREALEYAMEKGLPVGAICAAPSILGHMGYLKGRRATCYPGFEEDLVGAILCDDLVVTDGNITTGKGPGAAVEFALRLVEILVDADMAATIRSAMQCQ